MKKMLDLLKQDKKSLVCFIGALVIVAALFSLIFFAIGNNNLTNVVVTEAAVNQKLQYDEAFQNEKASIEEEKNKLSDEVASLKAEISSLESDLATSKSYIEDYKKNKADYESEISQKQADIKSLDDKISAKNAELSLLSANVEQKKGEPIYLTAGLYTAGTDFSSGKYNIELVSGHGNVFGSGTPSINEIFGSDSSYYISEYKNAKFSTGNTLEIKGNLQLKLIPLK